MRPLPHEEPGRGTGVHPAHRGSIFLEDGRIVSQETWPGEQFVLRIAAPKKYQPPADLLKRAGGKVTVTEDLKAAAAGADVLYADVWISMGKEAESAERVAELKGYQINADLVSLAKPGASDITASLGAARKAVSTKASPWS